MLTSERQWKLQESIAVLNQLRDDLPLIVAALKDAQHAGESAGPVAGGDRSDPTLATVVAAEGRERNLDKLIIEAHAVASKLARLRQGVLGNDGVTAPPPPEERDCCELHRLVLVEDEAREGLQGYERGIGDVPRNAEGVPAGRRWVTDINDRKRRVCRWCGDFFDRAGRLPYLAEVRKHINGQRVHTHERSGSGFLDDGTDLLERLNPGHPHNANLRGDRSR